MTKRYVIVLSLFFLVTLSAAPARAAEDVAPVPIPIDPSGIDLNGSWNYTRTAGTVSGRCPAGRPASGTISISQQGKQVALSILSGSTCKPASLCQFAGSLDGNQLAITNHAVVDGEGGNVTNAMGIVVMSNESMRGNSSSRYMHPGGFECAWESQITLSKMTGGNTSTSGSSSGDSSSTGTGDANTGGTSSSSGNGSTSSGSGTGGSSGSGTQTGGS